MDLALVWSHAVTEELGFLCFVLPRLSDHDHDESGKRVTVTLVLGQSSEVFSGIKRLQMSVPEHWGKKKKVRH